MSKPSIFSKDYEKEVKKRKKKILLLIIVPIIGLTIFLITDFNSLLNKGISMKNGINNTLLNKPKQDTKADEPKVAEVQKKEEKDVTPQPKAPQKKVVSENKTFIVTLSHGQKVEIQYAVNGTDKKIEKILNSKDVAYDISPSKKSVVIQSKIKQDLLYFDVNNISKDITKKAHTSSRGKVFLKQDKLKKNPNYSWSTTPKFIDEDNIVYLSELPWMNEKNVQYIWKINLKNSVHTQVKPASGKNIIFKNITPKGLESIIDGNTVYITSTGEVIK